MPLIPANYIQVGNSSFLGNYLPYFYFFFHSSHKASSEMSSNLPGQTGEGLLSLKAGTEA